MPRRSVYCRKAEILQAERRAQACLKLCRGAAFIAAKRKYCKPSAESKLAWELCRGAAFIAAQRKYCKPSAESKPAWNYAEAQRLLPHSGNSASRAQRWRLPRIGKRTPEIHIKKQCARRIFSAGAFGLFRFTTTTASYMTHTLLLHIFQ